MINLLIIIFTMTLIYLAVAGRFQTFVRILALQGLLLFGIAFYELKDIVLANLLFILLETLVVKALVVPYFFGKIIKQNKLTHDTEPNIPHFYSLLIVSFVIILTFILAYNLHDEHLKITYFTASVSSIFAGIFLIISRRKIITHIVGYMVMENGIFMLSLAIGAELPMIVNTGILLDLFTSVLVLGFFVSKISNAFHTVEVEKLTELKD
jgi:hydrogenase-4 component E